jgi:Surface antigen
MQDKRFGVHGEPWEPRVLESRQIPKVQAMLRTALAALAAFVSLAALPNAAHARLQCVTYARQVSDVQLSGNARDWWGNAAGTYSRGQEPKAGAVLAFRASSAMPYGHVAVVSKVVDARHVMINHANWSRPGMIERGVMAVDVSSAGDWSEVRVWYGPTQSLGLRPSPAFGFIYPHGAPVTQTASVQLAMADKAEG